MSNNKSQTNHGLTHGWAKVARLAALVTIFAVVFALALSCGSFNTASIDGNIALADDEEEGGTTPATGNNGALTSTMFGFPGNDLSATSWSFTDSFSNTNFTDRIVSTYKKSSTSSPLFFTPGVGTFTYGMEEYTSYSWDAYASFNYSCSPFLQSIITRNTYATVKAEVTATIYGSRGNRSGISAMATSSITMASGATEDQTSFTISKSDTSTISASTTLTAEKPNLVIAFLRGGTLQVGGKGTDIVVSNLSIKFTITYPSSMTDTSSTVYYDGAAPQTTSVDSASPLRTANMSLDNVDNWPVNYYSNLANTASSVAGLLSTAKDTLTTSKISLLSYTKTGIALPSGSGGSGNYYKTVSMTFKDYFKYDTDTTTLYTSDRFCSGIKTITVGDYDATGAKGGQFSIDLNNLSTSGAWQPVYQSVDDNYVLIGYAQATKVNRAEFKLSVYFTKNTENTVSVKVTDYGNSTGTTAIDVKGIDTTEANKPTLNAANNYGATSTAMLTSQWNYEKLIDVLFTDKTDYDKSLGNTPYIYYYQIQKVGTSPFSSFAKQTPYTFDDLLTLYPFAVGDFDTFEYDFTKGCTPTGVYADGSYYDAVNKMYTYADGSSKSEAQANNMNFSGNGYYYVRIYTLDLAGNYVSYTGSDYSGNYVDFVDVYFKVDCDSPEYGASVSYKDGTNNTVTIGADKDSNGYVIGNGKWAVSDLTLTLTQSVLGLSGNTLTFLDNNDTEHVIVIAPPSGVGKQYTLLSIDGVAVGSLASASINSKTYYVIPDSHIYANFALSGGNFVYSFIFAHANFVDAKTGYYDSYDFSTSFTLFNGVETDGEAYYVNKEWRYNNVQGIAIRVDRDAPVAPVLADANNYLLPSASQGAFASSIADLGLTNDNRIWYTNTTIALTLSEFEDMFLDTYGNNINVYYAMKTITAASGAGAGFLTASSFTQSDRLSSAYTTSLNATFGEGYWSKVGGTSLGEDKTFTNSRFDLRAVASEDKAGLRVFYVWSVDQAGNCSEVKEYYLLVDPTTYTVSAFADASYVALFGKDACSVSLVDAGGLSVSTFKRGDKLTVAGTLKDGFVPYMLTKRVNGYADVVLAQNNSAALEIPATEEYDSFISSSGESATVTMDAPSVFGYYNTGNFTQSSDAVNLVLKFREVLNVTVTGTSERYKGSTVIGGVRTPLNTVSYTINDASEYAKAAINFKFYTDSACSVATTPALNGSVSELSMPLNVGNYWFKAATDGTAVFDASGKDYDGKVYADYYYLDEIRSAYTIVPAAAIVSVNPSSSVYFGSTATLNLKEYLTISGLVGDDTLQKYIAIGDDGGMLVLSDASGHRYNIAEEVVHAGKYSVVASSPLTYANYSFTFRGGEFTVSPKQIVVQPVALTKDYGDSDPDFQFRVKAEDMPAGLSFSTTRTGASVKDEGTMVLYVGYGMLKRESGENVGTYNYLDDASEFVLASSSSDVLVSDYTVKVASGQQFTIRQRTIVITPVANQQFVDGSLSTDNIILNYKANDKRYSIYVEGTPSFDNSLADGGYFTIGTLAIASSPASGSESIRMDENLRIEFTSNVRYYVVSGESGKTLVTVKLKATKSFTLTYGDVVNANDYLWSRDNFTATDSSTGKELASNYDIVWTTDALSALPTQTSTVGRYTVRVSEAYVKDFPTAYSVVVESFAIEVQPKVVDVTPVTTSSTKVYGELDDDYNVLYKAQIGATLVTSAVKGSFVRVLRRVDNGEVYKEAGRYDDANGADGHVTVNGIKCYYSIAVGTQFYYYDGTTPNYNYSVEADEAALKETKLTISTRKLILSQDDFYGIDKVYDGSLDVPFGSGDIAVDLSASLARLSDDVKATFTAVYDNANAGSGRTITFSALALGGADAGNYALYVDSATPYAGQTYIVSGYTITPKTYTLKKTDFIISKQYDGVEALPIDGTVTLAPDCALYGMAFTVQRGSAFDGIAVGANHVLRTVTLNFAMTGANDAGNISYSQSDSDAGIDVATSVGGLTVTLSDVPGSIVKKEINRNVIKSINAVSRAYNTYNTVDIVVTFVDGFLVGSDTATSVGLNITAHASTVYGSVASPDGSFFYNGTTYYYRYRTEANVGYNIVVSSLTIDEDSNYTIGDLTPEIVTLFGMFGSSTPVQVNITKAQIELNYTLNDSTYNGQSELMAAEYVAPTTAGEMFIVTSGNNDAMMAQLASFTFGATKLYYTKDGKLYPYVNFDNGVIARHAVSVEGLTLKKAASSALSVEQLNTILANYQLAGTFYTVSRTGSAATALASPKLMLGADGTQSLTPTTAYSSAQSAQGYEIKAVTALMNRRTITIQTSNIVVKDKVYDTTQNGEATVDSLASVGIVAADANKVKVNFNCTFEQSDVGTNVGVSVKVLDIETIANDGIDYAANYILSAVSAKTYKDITASYALIAFDFDTKSYDGTTSVKNDAIRPIVTLPYPADNGLFSVLYKFGILNDSNVPTSDDTLSNSGKVYGISLTSVRKYANYNVFYDAGATLPTGVNESTMAADGSDKATEFFRALYGTENYYLVLKSEDAAYNGVTSTYNYIDVYAPEGKDFVRPTAATFTVSRITRADSVNKFIKPYDANTSFGGELGVDYRVTFTGDGNISVDNLTDNADSDRATYTYISGKFVSSTVGPAKVIFTVDLATSLTRNFSSADVTYTFEDAKITAVTMNAYLADASCTYGTPVAQRNYQIIYSTSADILPEGTTVAHGFNKNSDSIDVYNVGGVFGYFALCADTSAAGNYYALNADGSVNLTPATSIVGGTDYYQFVALDGVFTAPGVSTRATSNLSNYKATGYDMSLKDGKSTNFSFTYSYTGKSTSVLMIDKVKLYVYVIDTYVDLAGSSSNYSASIEYDSSLVELPLSGIRLGYAASALSNASGFIGGQSAAAFDIEPSISVKLYDGTSTLKDVTVATLTTSGKLDAGNYYVITINNDGSALNYEFELKVNTIADFAKLLVDYPAINDVSVSDTKVVYTGSNVNAKVYGADDTAVKSVSYAYYTKSDYSDAPVATIKDAGTYYAIVTVSQNERKDYVGYASVTITKATFRMTMPSLNYSYSGDSYSSEIASNLVFGNGAHPTSGFVFTYTVNGETVSASSVVDAGTYSVTIKYAESANFNAASATASVTIQPAVVTVSVADTDKNKLYDDKADMSLTYSLSCDDQKYSSILAALGYDSVDEITDIIEVRYFPSYATTEDEYSYTVDDADTYGYKIVSLSTNVRLTGAVSGTYVCGVDTVTYADKNATYLTVHSADQNVVFYSAATLSYADVQYVDISSLPTSTSANKLAVYRANNTLYRQIESNVPALASTFHTTSLAAVLKVQMLLNGSVVQPGGTISVSAQSPIAIDDSIQVFTVDRNGALQKVDYTYNNGMIEYQTDYLSAIVFVKVGTFGDFLNDNWYIYIIGGIVLAGLLAAIIAPLVVKQKKNKRQRAKMVEAVNEGRLDSNMAVSELYKPEQEPVAPAPSTSVVDSAPTEDGLVGMSTHPMSAPPAGAMGTRPTAPPQPMSAPPSGAMGTRPTAPPQPMSAPPEGALGGDKRPPAPKQAPPTGAVGAKRPPMPKKAPPTGAIGGKKPTAPGGINGADESGMRNPQDDM